jgi:hypothetical protein
MIVYNNFSFTPENGKLIVTQKRKNEEKQQKQQQQKCMYTHSN